MVSAWRETDDGEDALKTPISRVYLCPEEQIINCAMGFRDPVDVEALKKAFSNSIMIQHPRFCSLLVRGCTGEHWKRTHVSIDDHFIIHHPTAERHVEGGDDEEEAAVNEYLADLAVSRPLSYKKPLWEVHVLVGLKCVILRVHHAIGDGVSLMSMLSACFGEERETDAAAVAREGGRERKWKQGGLKGFIRTIWFTLVFLLRGLGKLLWFRDDKCVVSGGDGVELWPRKLVTVKFKLEDFKYIKTAIPNATINDVLLGVISSGLSKYLHVKSPNALLQGIQLSALVVVNLRKEHGLLQGMRHSMGMSPLWGNKTSFFIQPVHCRIGPNPMDHVRKMKAILDRKKQSYEPQLLTLAFQIVTSILGPKATSWCCHRVLCNTSLLVSNILGPVEEMSIMDNPITYLRVSISSVPQAMTIHMVSYGGRADLQVMVAKDIISDPDFLGKCFEDSLHEMMQEVQQN